jgi:hypothetical protein
MNRKSVYYGGAFIFGMLVAVCGLPFTKWQFWVIVSAAVVWVLFMEYVTEKSV